MKGTSDDIFEKPYSITLQQIAMSAAEGMVIAEKELLLQIQRHMLDCKGQGKEKVFPIWMCLWMLILTYRSTVAAYEDAGSREVSYHLAQHMYNMVISIYSGLFRTSSPLWLNWFKAEMFKPIVSEFEITRRIGVVKTEVVGYSMYALLLIAPI